MAVSLTVNGQAYELDVPDQMPLLWVIRDVIGLTGTKYGCGITGKRIRSLPITNHDLSA